MVVAGMSLGWADNSLSENQVNLQKLQLDDFAIFIDD